MNIVINRLMFIALFAFGTITVQAQERLQMKIGFGTAMPMGSFKEFMGKNSFRGYQAELTYPVSQRLRVGLGVAFNDFYEKHPRQTYNTKDGVISAVITNSIQVTPIQVKANYDLVRDAFIRPYVGIGAGANLIRFSQYLGEFGESESKLKPSFTADAGVNIPFNRTTRRSGINIGANYNYLPYKSDVVNNLSNWGVHAGLFFGVN